MNSSVSPSLKARTEEWFRRVWTEGDLSAIDELMDPGCEIVGLGIGAIGPEGFRAVHGAFHRGFSEIRVEPLELVEEGDMVSGHARFCAVHRNTGREVDMIFSLSGRFEKGRLVWIRNVVDHLSLMAQLKLFDPARIEVLFEGPPGME